MQKSYSSSFKFKVVIEALKGDMTITEIISKYQISKSVLHKWKTQFLTDGAKVFNSRSDDKSPTEAEIEKLHATIGKLTVEKDFLQAAWDKIRK